MSTILDLPDEIISIILSNDSINIQDIVNISITCKHFYDTVKHCGNKFWQQKFHQRWPRLKEICEKEIGQKHVNFKQLVKSRTKCNIGLRNYLAHMNKKWYFLYEYRERSLRKHNHYRPTSRCVTNKIFVDIKQRDLDFLIDRRNKKRNFLNYYYLMDELTSLLEQSKRIEYTDELTNIFYGKKLLPYLKHHHLRNVWQKFINRPARQQLLEEATVFVIQWYRPEKDISYSHIETELDNWAHQAMELLRIENRKHPIFSVSQKQLSFWKYNNINEDQWNEKDARQILDILCKVLRNKIGYIVSQAIIFHGVARRLGVYCNLNRDNMFNHPNPPLIWEPKYNITNHNYNYEKYFLITGLHDGIMHMDQRVSHTITLYPIENFETYYRLNSISEFIISLIRCMRKNTICDDYLYEDIQKRWLLELQILIQPNNIEIIKKLYNIYNNRSMNLSPIIIALKKIIDDGIESWKKICAKFLLEDVLRSQNNRFKLMNEIRHTKPKPKRRRLQMELAVGMMVRINNQNGQDIRGVIIGWEDIDPLLDTYRQFPNYTILCTNKILYRVSKDFIIPLTLKSKTVPINHEDIGKYFCQFNGFYYTPNEMMREEYEEDVLFLTNKYRI